jgi:hypothetical protein
MAMKITCKRSKCDMDPVMHKLDKADRQTGTKMRASLQLT